MLFPFKVQTIVDHHHSSEQKQATKVRFSEPGDEKDNEDESKVIINARNRFQNDFVPTHCGISWIFLYQETDSNKIDAEKGSAEYDTEKEAADSGEKDTDSNNLSNHSSPNKPNKTEINEKDELKALDASNEKDSDKQSDNEENCKQSMKPYVMNNLMGKK